MDQILKSSAPLVERILSTSGAIVCLHAAAGFGKTTIVRQLHNLLKHKEVAVASTLDEAMGMQACPWLLIDDAEATDINSGSLRHLLDRAADSRTGIVIATRHLETLPIARLRAEGKVISFGPRQLGIAQREADLLLRTAIDKKTSAWLSELIHNWSAATYLILEYAQNLGASFGEDGDFLHASGLGAYIDQEVLADLPPSWISALRFASIFHTCDASMLDFVCPGEDMGRHLASIQGRLVGLVESRGGQTWINPLLKLYLVRQFGQLPHSERVAALERAAQCCYRAGRVVEASRLATKVGSSKAIVDFVRRSDGLRLWMTGGYDVIRELVNQAGTRGADEEPILKLLKCLVHTRVGEISEAELLFDEVLPSLAGDVQAQKDAAIVKAAILIYGCKHISDSDLANFRKSLVRSKNDAPWQALVLSMQSILEIQRGNLDAAAAIIFEGKQHARTARAEYGEFFLDLHGINAMLARGDMSRARVMLGQARKTFRQKFESDVGLQTILDSLATSLEFEAGRLSSAKIHLRNSAQRTPHVEAWFDIYVATYEPMARMLVADMGLGPTLFTLKTEQEALLSRGLPRVAQLIEAIGHCLVGEAGLRGKTSPSSLVMTRVDNSSSLQSWQEREFFSLSEAYAALCLSQPEIAQNKLSELAEYAEEHGLQRSLLRSWLLQVAAFDQQGQGGSADSMFEKALTLGSQTGMSRAFVEIGGDAVRQRCTNKIASFKAGDFVDPKLARLLRTISRWAHVPPTHTSQMLTPREREVLVALEQGGSDKAIGRKLGVTEHAVRYHLLNIYRKLGVHDRLAALYKARDTGIFD